MLRTVLMDSDKHSAQTVGSKWWRWAGGGAGPRMRSLGSCWRACRRRGKPYRRAVAGRLAFITSQVATIISSRALYVQRYCSNSLASRRSIRFSWHNVLGQAVVARSVLSCARLQRGPAPAGVGPFFKWSGGWSLQLAESGYWLSGRCEGLSPLTWALAALVPE
jgi:hypothetical protein